LAIQIREKRAFSAARRAQSHKTPVAKTKEFHPCGGGGGRRHSRRRKMRGPSGVFRIPAIHLRVLGAFFSVHFIKGERGGNKNIWSK